MAQKHPHPTFLLNPISVLECTCMQMGLIKFEVFFILLHVFEFILMQINCQQSGCSSRYILFPMLLFCKRMILHDQK